MSGPVKLDKVYACTVCGRDFRDIAAYGCGSKEATQAMGNDCLVRYVGGPGIIFDLASVARGLAFLSYFDRQSKDRRSDRKDLLFRVHT